MSLYIGLMSGTSMDGIDAALVDLPDNTLVDGLTLPYSETTQKLMNEVLNATLSLEQICQLNTLIGREFAQAALMLLQRAGIETAEITAIGSHGQTICHHTKGPIPYTLQLGCAHTISSRTGISVVADFRTRDLVHGGQGAPFAPLYHHHLFALNNAHSAVVNIGGISNITFLDATHTVGWDLGPGNCLIDAWINLNKNKAYDADGAWASTGIVITELLATMLCDPFFALPTPKSVGKEYFSLAWLGSFLKAEYKAQDVQATLTMLTATVIINALNNYKKPIKNLYLCGGGVHNNYLCSLIMSLSTKVKVANIKDKGFNPDYLEAMMFAWLASQTINYQAVNLVHITGASHPAILGAIYPSTKSY